MPSHWYWKKRKIKHSPFGGTGPTGPVGPRGTIGPVGSTGVTSVYAATSHLATPVIEDRGLAIEPIVAARAFTISVGEGISLHSFNGAYWHPREPLAAYCLNDEFAHDAPHVDCTCGIYAWKNDENGRRNLGQVWGEVYLWGDVVVCELGYRAEMAYPKTLHLDVPETRASMRIRDALEESYGVPVTLNHPEKPEAIDVSTSMTVQFLPGALPPFTAPRGVPGYQIPPGAQGAV